MNFGLFLMPSHPPERNRYDAAQWDLDVIQWADQLGFSEVWIGEHFSSPWEPVPSPDLIIAQALQRTERIKLAPGAHLLPYHHPIELAHRLAYLDHLAQGRLMLGVGAGGLLGDGTLFDVDIPAGENRKMMNEAFDIMLKLWTEQEPFKFEGQYWNVNTHIGGNLLKFHMYPYQKPHMPIGITGLSPSSPTLKLCGERGYIPMSLGFKNEYIASHWDSVVEGAARTGRTPNREEWRITREVFVARTDEEALEWSLGGMMGRQHKEYWLPTFKELGALDILKQDSSVTDDEVTPEYMARTSWLVGSPDTVARKLQALYDTVGGFGTLLVTTYDYLDAPEQWKQSMQLLMEEVLPRIQK
ncbi:LLM class flavin-dependent oxidoreductase [Paenibacillus naphthalenovorans]|uniref:LLM class flavin-dependent oxidoreductase n=1 Tax=Paenibacillus naphthalenovorans TaxID=162209 RepID=UPI003D29E83C